MVIIETVGLLMASALSGIVGNKADAAVTYAFRTIVERIKNDEDISHDLHIVVQRSFIQAQQDISHECLDELKHQKKEQPYPVQWLETKRKSLQTQLKDVVKAEYETVPIEKFTEIETLLTPAGELAEEKIQEFKDKLFEVATKDSKVPYCYRKKVKEQLFGLMCDYFASEIKNNSEIRAIFEGRLLAQIDIQLVGQQITFERMEASLRDIAKAVSVIEKPILTLEQYLKRTEIKPLLVYTFIGRRAELNTLHDFLDGEKHVMVIVGGGGVGKTRLVTEFAREVKEEGYWDVYFVHPFISFQQLPLQGNILLILDDATRYKDRDKLIDFAVNPVGEDVDIKLLLLDRLIFKESIERYSQKVIFPSSLRYTKCMN